MKALLSSVSSLLLAVAILIMGNGLQQTLLPVRASFEGFRPIEIGLMGSFYYLGFVLGCVYGGRAIQRVGHIRTFTALASIGLPGEFPFTRGVYPSTAHPGRIARRARIEQDAVGKLRILADRRQVRSLLDRDRLHHRQRAQGDDREASVADGAVHPPGSFEG